MELKRDKEQALCALENDLLWLLERTPADGYRWMSTKRDLVEMTHEVWLRNVVFDSMGRVKPFIHLLRQVCRIVGVDMPKKPTAMLDSIAHRKDQEHFSIVNRYVQILRSIQRLDGGNSRPIMRFLTTEADTYRMVA